MTKNHPMKGALVKYTQEYISQETHGHRFNRNAIMEIVGGTTDEECWIIKYIGSKSKSTIHKSFVELINKKEDEST